jgi:hypothetical protein
MKLFFTLLFLATATHAFADDSAAGLPIWQSADGQKFDDPDLDAEAFWLDNGDTALVQQVYRPVGTGAGKIHQMDGTRRSHGQGWRAYGDALSWRRCTRAMVSATPQPGFVQTPRGFYRNPGYFVRAGGQLCAPRPQ